MCDHPMLFCVPLMQLQHLDLAAEEDKRAEDDIEQDTGNSEDGDEGDKEKSNESNDEAEDSHAEAGKEDKHEE